MSSREQTSNSAQLLWSTRRLMGLDVLPLHGTPDSLNVSVITYLLLCFRASPPRRKPDNRFRPPIVTEILLVTRFSTPLDLQDSLGEAIATMTVTTMPTDPRAPSLRAGAPCERSLHRATPPLPSQTQATSRWDPD